MSQPRARAGRKPSRPQQGGGRKPGQPAPRGGAVAPATAPRSAPAPAAKPRVEPPASVRNAIRVMYAGAAATLASLAATAGSASSLRDSLRRVNPHLTSAQATTLADSAVTFAVIAGLVFLGAWVGMIWASRKGHAWVRGMVGVLLLFNTAISLLSLRQGIGAGSLLSVLIWLLGLAAAVLLWRKDSAEFFRTARTR